MKKPLYLILILFIASCSTSFLFDNKLTPEQKVYVMSAASCAENDRFNYDGVDDFFGNEDKEIVIKSVRDKTELRILRKYDVVGKQYFLAEFKSKTFPFTKCRKLKSEPKYF